MTAELSQLQRRMREIKKEVDQKMPSNESEQLYFDGIKKGVELAQKEIKLALEIAKTKAKLEELEAQENHLELQMPAPANNQKVSPVSATQSYSSGE